MKDYNHCDEIKEYSVRIEYNYNSEDENKRVTNLGSGVIVKPNNNDSKICYVLTAQHNFKKSENSVVKKEEVNCDDINIYENCGKKLVCSSLEINANHDLAILFLSVENNQLKIEPISILNDKFESCIIVGYPHIRSDKNSKLECYKCEHDKTNDDIAHSLYEVKSDRPLESYDASGHENIQGLSGGGVFTKGSEGKYYLVGIQIEIQEPLNLRCLDLRVIAEEINECLPEKIGLEGYSFPDAIGIDPALLDFDWIKEKFPKNNLFIKQIKNQKATERLEYIKDNNNDFNRELKKHHKELDSQSKEIADAYLYKSILFHENGENRRATNNFKKAMEINPSYEAYFAEAKFRRKRSVQDTKELQIDKENLVQLEKRCQNALKTKIVEEDNESKLKLLQTLESIQSKKLTLVSDKQEQYEIYDDLIKTYLGILNIPHSEENNTIFNIRKADIFCKLGNLYINKKQYDIAKNFLQESLKLSNNLDIHQLETQKIYDDLIETYLSMLSIYSDDEENASHNFEKANIFNNLARLHINKKKI
jgi:tetratricopeptide (TPR) repeat protein